MKTIFALLLLVAVGAASKPVPVTQPTGIVTPDIAKGAVWTEHFAMTAAGDTAVCIKPNEHNWRNGACADAAGRNAWRLMQHSLPAGKTYVGFRISNGYRGTRYIEIYYK